MSLVASLFALMVSLVPLEQHKWHEAPAVTIARYIELALTIEAVAFDEVEAPLEDTTREETAHILATVAGRESYYRADAMSCAMRGLGGAWGPYQYQGPRALVCDSIDQATRWALHQLRESFARCARLQVVDRASLYSDGRCIGNWARSRARVAPALNFLRQQDPDT